MASCIVYNYVTFPAQIAVPRHPVIYRWPGAGQSIAWRIQFTKPNLTKLQMQDGAESEGQRGQTARVVRLGICRGRVIRTMPPVKSSGV